MASFGRLCDDLVVVDGAYMLYPGGRPKSHPQQIEAIVHTAEAMDCGVLLHQPKEIWYGNEVEKRNHSLRLAGTLDPDWVIVFDADYHVLRLDVDVVRFELANTEFDVASYTLLDGKDFLATDALAGYANQIPLDHEWTSFTRDIHRWNPTLKIGPAHWHYTIEDEGGRKWLRGPAGLLEPGLDLREAFIVYHRTQDRSLMRKKTQEKYYELRATTGVEEEAIVSG